MKNRQIQRKTKEADHVQNKESRTMKKKIISNTYKLYKGSMVSKPTKSMVKPVEKKRTLVFIFNNLIKIYIGSAVRDKSLSKFKDSRLNSDRKRKSRLHLLYFDKSLIYRCLEMKINSKFLKGYLKIGSTMDLRYKIHCLHPK